jgi:protein O-GlcNAc transferase
MNNNIEAAKASFFKGLDCLEKQDFANAESLFINTLELAPRSIPALNNLAIALYEQKKIIEASITATTTIEIDPRNIDAYLMLFACQKELKKYEEALTTCEAIIGIDPTNAQAHCGRGYVLNRIGKYQEAIENFDRALAIEPEFSDAFSNRGNSLRNLKRYDEAFAAFDKALALKPDSEGAWLGRGNAFCDLKRYDEAFAAFDKALALKPDLEGAWLGRGNIFCDLKRYDEAFVAFDKALSLKPGLTGLEGLRFHVKMHLCDWADFDTECAHLISSVKNGNANTVPFAFLGISPFPYDQLQCAKLWVAEKFPPSQKPIWREERYKHDRIRVAYVSGDFREHAVSYLTAGMFEHQDKSRFDVTAISLGPDDNSEMRQRLKASFERFIDAKTYNDDQIANLIKSSEVDILVDLMGFTSVSRTGIFARRVAPIQVNYLGYLGTMGAEYIDYIIADRVVIPETHHDFYTEKIVHLPNSFQPTDRQRPISDKKFTRAEVGLPQEGFVFCCFNASYKITPDVFDIWMRILKHVHGSVLWLVAGGPIIERNLKNEAAARGVSEDRLIFAQPLPLPEHQARVQLADLFLDTLPYNAGATASDMLWSGLPVLTRIGDTFVGRMAASLLSAIHLPELIVTTPEAYEQTAIELATDPEKLAAFKRRLAENRLTAPLFDTKLFTKHIEAAYFAMYQRYHAKLSSDHIVIPI